MADVKTRDGKLVCVEVTRPDLHPGVSCIWKIGTFSASDELDGAEAGESITLTLREMTEQELDDIGDFEGW